MNCCSAPCSDPDREQEPQLMCDGRCVGKESFVELNELLDEEFACMRSVAQGICQSLARPKDRECCRTMLQDLSKLNQSQSPEVKENVHKFLVFYLKALRWTQKNQPLEWYQKWYGCSQDMGEEQRVWVEEGRSYAAMKEFEDGSTIVYVATAKYPCSIWTESGLKSLAQQDDRL